MTCNYYLWKWADNDLPGQPDEIFSDLLHGKLHPAVQPFDARPMFKDLQSMVMARRALREDWRWQVFPSGKLEAAHAILLQCPNIPDFGVFREHLKLLTLPWGLSGYDEQNSVLISDLLPKDNYIELWEKAEETRYDIVEKDLPEILGRLHHCQFNPTVLLMNRFRHYIQAIARHDGFELE